jgi:Fur family peroxide stress response transcriptional regulator
MAVVNSSGRIKGKGTTLREQFRARCVETGLACTHQRQVIYRILMEPGRHWTPDELYQQVHKQIPSISLATVYKTIKTFREAGLVRELNLPYSKQCLDANLAPHQHLVCLACRKVKDLCHVDFAPALLKARIPKGFQVQRYSLEILGVCEDCSGKFRQPIKTSR